MLPAKIYRIIFHKLRKINMVKLAFILMWFLFIGCKDRIPYLNKKFPTTFSIKTTGPLPAQKAIWLHKTNSISKLRKHLNEYNGFELDIVIDTLHGFFDIYHPPEKSEKRNFEEYLKLPGSTSKSFWLDCKNLTKKNVRYAIQILSELDSQYHIKHRIIFESNNNKILSRVKTEGYACFFYLTLPVIDNGSIDSNYLKSIADKIDTGFSALSFDSKYLPVFNYYFPNCKKATWSTNTLVNLLRNEKGKAINDSSTILVLEKKLF